MEGPQESKINRKLISITGAVIVTVIMLYILANLFPVRNDGPYSPKVSYRTTPASGINTLSDTPGTTDFVKAESILSAYSAVLNNQQEDSIGYFFADSLTKFYLKDKVANEFISQYYKWFWKRHPESRVIFYFDEMRVDTTGNGKRQFYIKGQHIRNENSIFNFTASIKFNDEWKIFYIRDFTRD